MAKFSISVEELTREDTLNNPRRQALMGGVDPETAERKAVSIMYLALGDAARKTLLDRNPSLNAKTISLKQMMKEGESAFKVKRNRTMDRFLFLTRKQGEQETLEQFWNALNGLASICELQGLTKSLVHDVFIVNMRNTAVQERLCTEPRDDPEDALKFAIAFEQGVQQKNNIGKVLCIKEEPIFAVTKDTPRSCYRCGASNFKIEHLKGLQGKE